METRFLFDDAWSKCFQEWLDDDIAHARFSRQFRMFYRVRSLLPIVVRQLLQRIRNRRLEPSEDWYLPTRLIERLVALHSFKSIWPHNAPFAFVLTHDVETKAGIENIDRLAAIEESFGFRSCWNIVPHKYSTDPGLVRDLRARGHEWGVHGYNHDGKLFLSERIFNSRVPAINAALESLDAVGFRAPMVHRNLHWMQRLNAKYDSSCFDVDPFQAMPGGVYSWWPFKAGKLIELPYTLPQDHTLFVTLGETTDRIWREKLDLISLHGGMALMLTHPDYLDSPSRLDIYKRFLAHICDTSKPWHVLPRDMAAWAQDKLSRPETDDSHCGDRLVNSN